MNLEAGIRFIIFLIIFGLANYLIMLRRYEKELKQRNCSQQNEISKLYPKGTFIHL